MPTGILAGLFLGAAHLVLFHRGVSLACSIRRPSAARWVALSLSAMRFLMTASAGYAMVRSGISALGLGTGLLIALYAYRISLMMIPMPREGRV